MTNYELTHQQTEAQRKSRYTEYFGISKSNIRKDKDFNVTDKIVVTLHDHELIRPAVEQFGDYICNEVLAVDLNLAEVPEGEAIEIDAVKLNILVEKQDV